MEKFSVPCFSRLSPSKIKDAEAEELARFLIIVALFVAAHKLFTTTYPTTTTR